MSDEIRLALARHLPDLAVDTVVRIGGGLDNVAYEVDGRLVVRQSRLSDPEVREVTVRRDAMLLAAVAQWSTLPVPTVEFADPDAGVLAYAKLPGTPLLDQPVADPPTLARVLGEFLTRLHEAPVTAMRQFVEPDDERLWVWLADAREDYDDDVAALLSGSQRALVEAFLAVPPPPEAPLAAFCHNDLGAEHILVEPRSGAVTGVIDWTDAAIADPARDLARIYRDLGPGLTERVLAHYGGTLDPHAPERIRFYARCALIEDVAYGLRTGQRRYVDAGLAHLGWTFG